MSRVYTASSAYTLFLKHPTVSHPLWNKIWRLNVPEKVCLFVCLFFPLQAFDEALPTNCKKHAWHLGMHSACTWCSSHREDVCMILPTERSYGCGWMLPHTQVTHLFYLVGLAFHEFFPQKYTSVAGNFYGGTGSGEIIWSSLTMLGR